MTPTIHTASRNAQLTDEGISVTWLEFACGERRFVPRIMMLRDEMLARIVCKNCGSRLLDLRQSYLPETSRASHRELFAAIEGRE